MKEFFTVLVLTFLLSHPAFSWGPEGHETVALVAQQILQSQSQKNDASASKALSAINAILGQTPINQAATWPDEVKQISRECTEAPYKNSAICDAYKATAQWHFTTVNADIGQTEYSFPSTDVVDKKKGSPYSIGDLVIIIKGLTHVLRNENAPVLTGTTSFTNWKEQCLKKTDHNCKKEALEFLIHFLGDIHQPLHSGASCDVGGNSQYIRFFGATSDPAADWCKGKPETCTNHELHQAWDTTLLVKNVYNPDHKPPVPVGFSATYAANLVKVMAGKQESSDAKKCMKLSPSLQISQENIDEANGPNNGPISWVNESVCYFPQVYTFPDDTQSVASKKKDKKTKRAIAQVISTNNIPNLCSESRKTGQGFDQAFSAFDVGQKYYDINRVTINERLYWAGARLANVLKYIYGEGDKVQGELQ